MSMKIGVPKEVHEGECRVALTPETAEQIQKLGFSVALETGAGEKAHFTDEAYREAGVEIYEDVKALWTECDIVMKVRAPECHPALGIDESELLREGGNLISFIWPAQNAELMDRLKARKATIMAMDSVPRISRARSLMPLAPWPISVVTVRLSKQPTSLVASSPARSPLLAKCHPLNS